jgi:antitoxin HicB
MNKPIEYYLNLDYTILLKRNHDGTWFAKVVELPGCITEGDTPEEALAMVRDAQRSWIEVALEDGASIPEPIPVEDFTTPSPTPPR